MAIGGDLEATECHASIGAFSFVNGRVRLNTKSSLPQVSLTIPHKEGPDKDVALVQPTESRILWGFSITLQAEEWIISNIFTLTALTGPTS